MDKSTEPSRTFFSRFRQWVKKVLGKAPQAQSFPTESWDSLKELEGSNIEDWRHAFDELLPTVRNLRNDIDSLDAKELTFDLLGAGTFLLQIDLLLIKIRQHYNNYERRIKELKLDHTPLHNVLMRVQQSCHHTYIIMLKLQSSLKNRTYRDLNHHEVINEVHALESETKKLGENMQALNDMALKRDPLYQLFEAELLRTLTDLKSGRHERCLESLPTYVEPTNGPLRSKAQVIAHPERRQIAFCLIACFESLKRCSILFQHHRVSQLMELYRNQVDEFLTLAQISHAREQDLGHAINELFHTIDAMRFAPVKGFKDKAIYVKKQMKQGLEETPTGQLYLRTIRMSPKVKLSLKDKFK